MTPARFKKKKHDIILEANRFLQRRHLMVSLEYISKNRINEL